MEVLQEPAEMTDTGFICDTNSVAGFTRVQTDIQGRGGQSVGSLPYLNFNKTCELYFLRGSSNRYRIINSTVCELLISIKLTIVTLFETSKKNVSKYNINLPVNWIFIHLLTFLNCYCREIEFIVNLLRARTIFNKYNGTDDDDAPTKN
jgi:hypothetical protein